MTRVAMGEPPPQHVRESPFPNPSPAEYSDYEAGEGLAAQPLSVCDGRGALPWEGGASTRERSASHPVARLVAAVWPKSYRFPESSPRVSLTGAMPCMVWRLRFAGA